MKLTKAESKIVGLQLGEASINWLHPGRAPLEAKFALMTEEGPVGFIERKLGWSDATMELMKKLSESMETDALTVVFKNERAEEEVSETSSEEKSNEPPQF